MSLDIYLTRPVTENTHAWDFVLDGEEQLFDQNITHNLGTMAVHAGVYHICWDLENVKRASDMIMPLRLGIIRMENEPEFYERFNAKNGWGLYKHFVPWLKKLLEACETYPDAKVRVSR